MSSVSGRTRLQLRWEDAPAYVKKKYGEASWLCNYELVLPLAEFDPRAFDDDGVRVRDEHAIEMNLPQLRMGTLDRPPCHGSVPGKYVFEPPFRLLYQVIEDSAVLGLPLVVIAVDGTVIERPEGWKP